MRKLLRVMPVFFYLLFFTAVVPTTLANSTVSEQPCNQVSWTGEDDVSHQIFLHKNVSLSSKSNVNIYASTNGALTFGSPSTTHDNYPYTPSVSVAGFDWVTSDGGHLSYGATDSGFCVEWMVRPYPQSSGSFTTIKLKVDTTQLPSWSGVIETTGWIPNNLRRGIRFISGQDVVTILESFTVNNGRLVEMQSCWDGSVIPTTSVCPTEPSETPQPTPTPTSTYTPEPTTSPTQSPEPTPSSTELPTHTPEPSATQSSTPSPLPTQTPTPSPEPTPTETPKPTTFPTAEPSSTPSPALEPVPTEPAVPSSEPTVPPLDPSNQPLDTPIVDTDPNTSEQISNANSDGIITAQEQTQITDSLLSDGDLSTEEVTNLSDTLSEDGALSEEDKQVLADVLIIAFIDAPSIPFADLIAAGLTYTDLPSEQPVSLENGVVLTASVADAIQLFEAPSKITSAIFSDPGKAFKAVANVGADMTPATRKKAEQAVVPAVIVSQAIAGVASLRIRNVASLRTRKR